MSAAGEQANPYWKGVTSGADATIVFGRFKILNFNNYLHVVFSEF
jgi:hypothetical protein